MLGQYLAAFFTPLFLIALPYIEIFESESRLSLLKVVRELSEDSVHSIIRNTESQNSESGVFKIASTGEKWIDDYTIDTNYCFGFDHDFDGYCDDVDNCVYDYNPFKDDVGQDLVGDLCDSD